MIDKVTNVIEQFDMLEYGDHVVIGLSGGADSICLTHLLLRIAKKYGLRLTAVHVNHNIRTEGAVNDQNFVKDFCEKNELPLKIFSIDVKKTARDNAMTVEEAGRQQRYKAFASIGADKIAVAHNLNDNAETMLMRLCRGTGLKGMGGILPVRDNIIRPLIMTSRADIEAYCRQNGLAYCTDETNLTTDYTRNKIRHLVLPLLEEINPSTMSSLGKNAFLFRQENDLIEEMALNAYNDCANGNRLNAAKLMGLAKPLLYRVLRLACENVVGLKDISLEHIEIIENLISKPSGKRVDLPKELSVIREYDSLAFVKTDKTADIAISIDVPIRLNDKNIMLSASPGIKEKYFGIYCNADKPDWRIRTRKSGDIFMRGDGREIKLKKMFIDKKIPLSMRNTALLLADKEKVYWVDCIKNKYSQPNYFLYVWEDKNE